VTDWEAHFKKVSQRPTVTFGSLMGMQTVAELKDLLVAKDNEIAQFEANFAAHPSHDSDLIQDWNNLKDRYAKARAFAQEIINVNQYEITPASMSPAQAQWDAVIHSLQQDKTKITKGDLQDIYNRNSFAETHVPQPTATDFDLKTMNALPSLPDPTKPTNWILAIALGLAGIVVLNKVL
jgi:hypothetical protein